MAKEIDDYIENQADEFFATVPYKTTKISKSAVIARITDNHKTNRLHRKSDTDFLRWIHRRLADRHGENRNCSHMQRLKKIITKMEDE